MQFDFSNLKKMEVLENKLADYPLSDLEGEPVLKLFPASEANKPYYNELLRRSRSRMSAIKSKKITAQMLQRNRDEDRELYALHVVKGWVGIKDANGNLVEFSAEAAEGFLKALPNWMFDDLRAWASDPTNWVDIPDVEDTVKN
jgi:hypothetical protein